MCPERKRGEKIERECVFVYPVDEARNTIEKKGPYFYPPFRLHAASRKQSRNKKQSISHFTGEEGRKEGGREGRKERHGHWLCAQSDSRVSSSSL